MAATVHLYQVKSAASVDPDKPAGQTTHKAAVLLVERALVAEGLLSPKWIDGSYGTQTVEAYAAWQRALGYTGKDSDGMPGLASLRELGKLHDFTVVDD